MITSHGPMFRDAVSFSGESTIEGNLGRFRAPQVSFRLDVNLPLTEQIINYAQKEDIPCIKITKNSEISYRLKYELDHGTMVPLYFVNRKFTGYKLVHITYGLLPKLELYRLGMCIKKAVEGSDTKAVLIASGDLSHRLLPDGPYEYSPYGEKFDKELISLLKKGDVLGVFNMNPTMVEEAGECGLRSYYILLGAMHGFSFHGELLAYQGTFGVGYMVMKFSLQESEKDYWQLLLQEENEKFEKKLAEEDIYVRLARDSLTYYLNKGKYLKVPDYVDEDMKKTRRGVFVSLKKNGQLRGCIGTIFPTTENVAEEIIRNAVAAGTEDPRFEPVRKEELKSLDISVDVLTEPEKATRQELDPKKYGVIVRRGFRTGVLLPDLEGVDTVEEQLEIALRKAGINPQDDYTIEKFEVVRHK